MSNTPSELNGTVHLMLDANEIEPPVLTEMTKVPVIPAPASVNPKCGPLAHYLEDLDDALERHRVDYETLIAPLKAKRRLIRHVLDLVEKRPDDELIDATCDLVGLEVLVPKNPFVDSVGDDDVPF